MTRPLVLRSSTPRRDLLLGMAHASAAPSCAFPYLPFPPLPTCALEDTWLVGMVP